MSKKDVVMRKVPDKTLALKVLRTVRNHEGFWFYNGLGNYTGKNAVSLSDFSKILRVVEVESVDFHFGREDFRRWVQFILGDVELCVRINRVPKDVRGERLRSSLVKIVDDRIIELKKSK